MNVCGIIQILIHINPDQQITSAEGWSALSSLRGVHCVFCIVPFYPVKMLGWSVVVTRISVHSALEVFVDALYKSTFTYLLTYLLTYKRIHLF